MADINVKVGQKFPLTIKRLGINGEGVGYYKRKAMFVPDALPGEVVLVQVTRVNTKYLEGKMLKIRERSKDRVKAPCPVFHLCGGCQIQHLSYPAQLEYKQQIIKDSLDRYAGHIPEDKVSPVIGMAEPFRYRNMNLFPVEKSGRTIRAGLYKEHSNTLIDIDDCIVQDSRTMAVTNEVKRIMSELNIDVAKNPQREDGVRFIVTRIAKETGDIQVVIVATTASLNKLDMLAERIMRIPGVKSLALNINADKESRVLGPETLIIKGEPTIRELLAHFEYDLTPEGFFQINTEQSTVLYKAIKDAAALTGTESVADLFCGTGGSALWLAEQAEEVRGVHVDDAAIINAVYNAALNNIENCKFEAGEPLDKLEEWIEEGFYPDVITVNPTRAGLSFDELDAFNDIKPKTLIYISRNPSSLAKDLAHLTKAFTVDFIQPVDMFPQTVQVEMVVKFSRKKRLG
ncbi:23S rRNA (uracil(1939)-C(5))-methyltransferase RlmD [Macrococcus equipercicus]|uniref:23S rRNA (Uracil(1939)-C(5))-methyltransferase RlmD n=1 Tax=Macrococcus equipercicus TaxID=69967 RepID=A0ABQ6R727_9STAP|nr:23S rRNA (uracil(1939)-C(5))-methyltransferase RlmD [Macrococcus equipercicus]KAA1037676.1 23S rRNA (uracil(1939)-C(5))-methyltransferase RlmD [Macrococcus equipercicus]